MNAVVKQAKRNGRYDSGIIGKKRKNIFFVLNKICSRFEFRNWQCK